ncbi:hypothetical protein BD626DRAFT_72081 [Schizophyllum amplum]|uniref:Uncharacterized protein n=1 Tax=Schizophyllum amplum TaxID=97359 RepID=A0A550CAF0_9AGAR|nr:hypothetical protein BD626DRAFT_72081 [Auriculariopsis ampla]
MFDFLHVFDSKRKAEARKAKRVTVAALERPTFNDSATIAVGTIQYHDDDTSSGSMSYSPIEQKRTMLVFQHRKRLRKSMDPSHGPPVPSRPDILRTHSEPHVPLFVGRHKAVLPPRAIAEEFADFSIFRQTDTEGEVEEPFYGTGTEALRNVRDVAARRVPLYHNSSTAWVGETAEIVDPQDYNSIEAMCVIPPFHKPNYASSDNTTPSPSDVDSDDHEEPEC